MFLIDGYANIFRAYYAIRNLSNAKGEPTNAVFGFLQILRKLLRDEQPEYIGIALDVSRRTVRSERFEQYKANRAPMPEDLRPQIPWIRQLITALKIPVLELPNYEADDVLGSLAQQARAAGFEVILVSPDKDLMQLVGPGISQHHTGRDKRYDAQGVEEDFGVAPDKVVDVLALMGDSVDNVPGVPGIGEKGAKALIREFGSLDELLAHPERIAKKSYRESLTQHREQALLSRDLVKIHTDLPIPFEPDRLIFEPPDYPTLLDLCYQLDFHSVAKELEAQHPRTTPALPAAASVSTVAAWQAWVSEVRSAVCLGRVGEGPPWGLAAARVQDGGADAVVFADFRSAGIADVVTATLRTWLISPAMTLIGHDLKEILRLAGVTHGVRCRLFDTMLASYLLRPALRSHGLAEVAHDRLHYQLASGLTSGPPLPGDLHLLRAAAEQVLLPAQMAPAMQDELAAQALVSVYEQIEAPLIPVLVDMEETGVMLDVPYLVTMSEELGQQLLGLETEIYRLAGERFNINSPQQLGEILFDKLGYPVLQRTRKTRTYSTGAETLEELALRGFPLAEQLLRYRELSKLKSTYVDAFPVLVSADGRLHTRFNQAVAATGRLSSANPNLQNIPIRTELGQRMRKAFRTRDGYLLVVADYSQIELRVLAHIAEEAAMIAAFRTGEDIHSSTAGAVFGVSPLLVTAEQRRIAKVINFGIIYGMSAWGLARQLRIGQKDAEKFIRAYLERYPGVARYTEDTVTKARETGKVETLYGRIRWLPDINSRNHNLRENARRMAINARIQGTAADLLKLAMIVVDARLRQACPQARLLLTVHDELVLEAPAADAPAAAAVVRTAMEGVAELRVPLVVEVGSGPTWYDAKA